MKNHNEPPTAKFVFTNSVTVCQHDTIRLKLQTFNREIGIVIYIPILINHACYVQGPSISVVTSGGGMRAMVGTSGAIRALQEEGLLSCCTYMSTLSGSTW